MEEKVVSIKSPIPRKELKVLKALRPEDQIFEFSFYMYCNRERLIGEVDLSDLDCFLENINIDLNGCTENRDLPLIFLAIDFYAPAVLKFLLDRGVNVEVKTVDGLSPLEFAEKTLQNAINIGWKPDSLIGKCAKQSIELLYTKEDII